MGNSCNDLCSDTVFYVVHVNMYTYGYWNQTKFPIQSMVPKRLHKTQHGRIPVDLANFGCYWTSFHCQKMSKNADNRSEVMRAGPGPKTGDFFGFLRLKLTILKLTFCLKIITVDPDVTRIKTPDVGIFLKRIWGGHYAPNPDTLIPCLRPWSFLNDFVAVVSPLVPVTRAGSFGRSTSPVSFVTSTHQIDE